MRYQKIHSQIWNDEKFIKLSQDAKFLFLYILTSPHSNSIGLYVLPKKYITCDLSWGWKQLQEPFHELLQEGLILYDETVSLICVKNHLKHNPLENENQSKYAGKIISSLPKSSLYSIILEQLTKRFHEPLREALGKQYAKPETETETETETEYILSSSEKSNSIPFEKIISYLNQVIHRNFSFKTKNYQTCIRARWREGKREEDFKKVVDIKFSKWGCDEKMVDFLRPETLFGSKMDSYLQEAINLGISGEVTTFFKNDSGNYQCKSCGKTYMKIENLKEHFKEHSS